MAFSLAFDQTIGDFVCLFDSAIAIQQLSLKKRSPSMFCLLPLLSQL
jgi:hypothetical protein